MVYPLHIRRPIMALMLVIAAALSTAAATAQPVFTSPPCTAITVINNHPTCTAQIRFTTNPPGMWPPVINVPPGGGVFPLPLVPVTTVVGITDVFGTFFAFNAPPPVLPCGPGTWWIAGIQLDPNPLCRFTVCADPATCTITLW